MEIINVPFILLAAPEHYGLFLADDDSKKGLWLESGRSLEYYLLRTGVSLFTRYRNDLKFSDR